MKKKKFWRFFKSQFVNERIFQKQCWNWGQKFFKNLAWFFFIKFFFYWGEGKNAFIFKR